MKNKEVRISQSNYLTQARYDFSKIEKRALYFIIQEVRKQFIEKEGQRDLFNDLIVTMKTDSLKSTDSMLRDIYASLQSLRQKSIWIEDKDVCIEVGWINYSKHKKGTDIIQVQVSHIILPYLVQLAEQFTTYSLTVAISLRTKYSQRFYEYCSQFKSSGFMYITIDELRQQMKLEDKYPRYSQVKNKIVDVAQKELFELYKKDECDLYFKYTEDRTGRSVKALKITVITKDNDSEKLKPEDMIYHIRTWLEAWLKASSKPKNKEWVSEVISHLQKNPDLIKKLYQRLLRMQKTEDKSNFAPLSRHIIEEDYRQ